MSRASSSSEIGFNACPTCRAHRWDFVTDSQTGTTCKQCQRCGHVVTLNRGYIDRGLGMFLDHPRTVGSWWTQSVASTFVSHETQVGEAWSEYE